MAPSPAPPAAPAPSTTDSTSAESPPGRHRHPHPSPELRASILSLLTWYWLRDFISLGNSRRIEADDLYDMNPKESAAYCEELWKTAVDKERRQLMNSDATPSIWKLLWHSFGIEYAKASIYKPIWLVAVVMQVYILRAMINIVADRHNFKWWWGTLLILGMFTAIVVASLAHHLCLALSMKVGMKIRSAVSVFVFNTILRTKLVLLMGASSGNMLNLVTNDTQKLLDCATYFHFVWFCLVELATVSILTLIEVGVSAIPGIILAFLTIPMQIWMARTSRKLRIKAVKYTDERVHLMAEVLNGIRVIKYNGWIAPFLHRISDLRNDEIRRIKNSSYIRSTTSTIRDCITPLASLLTFGTYYAIHDRNFMPASQAFTILALFSILVRTFSIAPIGIQVAGEAIVAVSRLQKLLDLDKTNNSIVEDNNAPIIEENPSKDIMIKYCSFSWESRKTQKLPISDMPKITASRRFDPNKVHTDIELENESEKNIQDFPFSQIQDTPKLSREGFILEDIMLSVGKGQMVGIYGTVGSGKSSLLCGILGEMECLKGQLFVQRNVAYVPQQAWILNDTIRRNVVFGSPYYPERYQRTIAACALVTDISQIDGGHDAEIGERGINLSGGQKARVSLARACYSSAPVVLLDDPFAAVDLPTVRHLIDNVLNGILQGRTVVLVTHNKTALSVCDQIYSMENGRLLEGVDHGEDPSDFIQEKETESNRISDVYNSQNTDYDSMMDADTTIRKEEVFLKNEEKLESEDIKSHIYDIKSRATVTEDRVEGSVHTSTWLAYARASGGLAFFSCVMLSFMIAQSVRVMVDYWLSVWTQRKYHLPSEIYLITYAVFAIGATALSISRALVFTYATMIAATKMHKQMTERVLRAPQQFFDQNLTGRILNRFSKDQALVDETLPVTAQQMLEYSVSSFGSLLIVGILLPWFLLTFPPFIIFFFYTQRRYVVISRELKRLEAISRSPVYAHFSQTLQGVVSVRAYARETEMHKTFISLVDANHRPFVMFLHLSRWLGIQLDFATILCVTLASILVLVLRHSISPGLAGVVLVQSLQVTSFIQFSVRQAAETENYLTSIERVQEYVNLVSEADPTTRPGIIEESWPSQGEIEFKDYVMSYRIDLPPVLNGISFKVLAGEKIGILGRTGAGKSSLVAALFRMVENEKCSGDIFIDGINIKNVGLDDLRKRLSIIPQDPVLFQGSVRFNLDPFQLYSDLEIHEALSSVHLSAKIQNLERGLDSVVTQNGENFSVGERQLLCLARSMLRKSKVIVMDEATAAVDGETDKLIQATIRTTFHDCTVLTVAHRIDTVIDCDRLLILRTGGHIAEYGSPISLLEDHPDGMFAEMVRKAGSTVAQRLHEAAREAANRRAKPESNLQP